MIKPNNKDQNQSQKFIKVARELGIDEDEAAFKRKLARLAKAKQPEKKKAAGDG